MEQASGSKRKELQELFAVYESIGLIVKQIINTNQFGIIAYICFLSMYEKSTSLFLQIIEYTNLAIIIIFLLLFTYRLYTLRSYSLTQKFDNYFPKLRIFFCLAYIGLSTSLIGYNIDTDSYSQKVWYEYVLQGGGGECIDSIILLIQLGVLRLQLKKEQPYTKFHIWYFIYLMIMSLARFILTFIDMLGGLNDLANTIISGLLVADSIGQFAYWIKNRQSLPEFISHTHEEIDESRYQSQYLQKRMENAKRSMHSLMNDHFPYINVFVGINNGKIKINLERTVHRTLSDSIVEDENGLNQSFLDRQTALRQEFLASSEFTIDEIKKFYTICGRFQLRKQLDFHLDMRNFIKQLENFLADLFLQKKCYTQNILKALKVPANIIQSYQQLLQKTYFLENRGIIDVNTGLEIIHDKNGVYFSLNLYRFMWVSDHYEYYMRITTKEGGHLSYPIKRMEEIQELYQLMKKMVKIEGKAIDLPSIPKLHNFLMRDDDLLRQNLKDIQIFLRKLVNEQGIMEDANLRQKLLDFIGFSKQEKIIPKYNAQFYQNLKIMKGRISKAFIKNEYVTLYEFKIYRNDIQIKTITKRFREIDTLHHDIERWLKDKKMMATLSLPEKVIYKTQIRHQKLKNYLENVLQLKDVFRCYGVSSFFDSGQTEEDRQSFISTKSSKISDKQRYTLNNPSLFADLENIDASSSPPSSRASKMFSKIIDDLGNEEYD